VRERRRNTPRTSRLRRDIRRGFLDDELPFDANKVVMSCLFQGIMDGVDEATELGIDDILSVN